MNNNFENKGINGLTFVATDDLCNFGRYNKYIKEYDHRDLKEFIENRGGFLESSISSKTDYFICNSNVPKTAKLKQAEEFGTKIITEEEFLLMIYETVENNFVYHEVDDGISLDEFIITPDMCTITNAGEYRYLESLTIPEEISGKPVVELSADFHKDRIKMFGWLTHALLADYVDIPSSLKRIKCPLINRGIRYISVAPDNPYLIFDDFAWYEDGGETLAGIWKSGPREYSIRNGAVRASETFRPSVDKLYFPDTFKEVHDSFLVVGEGEDRESSVQQIYASGDSVMKKYAEDIGAEFVALDQQEIKFSDDGTTLMRYSSTVTDSIYYIPDGVRKIKKYAFQKHPHLKEVHFSDSVETIGEGAFLECPELETVVLSSKIKELPALAFAGCKKLKIVKWPENLLSIGEKCFAGASFDELLLPQNIKHIHDYAFAPEYITDTYRKPSPVPSKLKSVEVPKSVKVVGLSVFPGVENIVIYDSVNSEPSTGFLPRDLSSIIGFIGINQGETFTYSAYNSALYRHTITVKSAESNKVKFKVLMYGEEEQKRLCEDMISAWQENVEFNFQVIDDAFSKLKSGENKLQTAINRLLYPINLSEKAKSEYDAHITRNSTKVATKVISAGNVSDLIAFEQYGIISKKNIKQLLELSTSIGQAEITAYLSDYKSKL